MRRFHRPFIAVFAIVLVLASLWPLPAHAADFNLTASPLPVDVSVKPGGHISTPLKVQNTGSQTVTINVSLKKFGATDKTGKPMILDPGPQDDFIKWVHFSQTSFQAVPNVWNTVTMTISPPPDAAFGYYYAVLFSQQASNEPATKGVHNNLHGAIASLVLLDVNVPGEKRTLQVSQFVSAKKVYEYLPADFTITIHNVGNVHAVPAGDVFITKNHKDNVAILDINNAGGNVLPGTERQFQTSWNDGFPSYQVKKINGQVVSDSHSLPVRSLSWNGLNFSKFRFGKYYAHLVVTYNDGVRDIPVEGELSFWVLPWKLMLIALTIILLIGVGLFFTFRGVFRGARRGRRRK